MNISESLYWILSASILFILLILLLIPQNLYEETNTTIKECNCYGIPILHNSQCIGFNYNCTSIQKQEHHEQISCEELSCEELIRAIQEQDQHEERIENYGADIIIVIDVSNSMEGRRFQAAKEAATSLAQSMPQRDRIGIISFSDKAILQHELSSNKETLRQSIEDLELAGGTTYLPALQMAEDMITEQHRESRKGIIFLSDGVPTDDTQAILAKSRYFHIQNITLFTINFGIIDEENNILKDMTREDSFPRLYKSYLGAEDLQEGFQDAYKEITNIENLQLQTENSYEELTAEEFYTITYTANINKQTITSKPTSKGICLPSTKGQLLLVQEQNQTIIPLVWDNNELEAQEQELKPGTYTVTGLLHLALNTQESCTFSGRSALGTMRITEDETACTQASCNRTRTLLQDHHAAIHYGMRLERNTQAARVVYLLDTSESMKHYIEAAKQFIIQTSKMLEEQDQQAIITYDMQSNLRVPFTHEQNNLENYLKHTQLKSTTLLAPALEKAELLLRTPTVSTQDIIILITDGEPYDSHKDIQQVAHKLIEQGVCINIIGYGSHLLNNKEDKELFESIQKHSQEKHGCGYYTHRPTLEQAHEILTKTLKGTTTQEELAFIIRYKEEPNPYEETVMTVQVTSAQTSLRIPLKQGPICIASPQLEGKIIADEVEHELIFEETIQTHTAKIPQLLPGEHELIITASIPTSDCVITSTKKTTIIVKGKPSNNSEHLITASIIILVLAITLFILHAIKILQKKTSKDTIGETLEK